MKIYVIHHQKAQHLPSGYSDEVRANPPLTPDGMEAAYKIARRLKSMGVVPQRIYSSSMARAMGTTSALIHIFDGVRMSVMSQLTVRGYRQKDGGWIFQNKEETPPLWLANALSSFHESYFHHGGGEEDEESIIMVSHLPIIAAMTGIAHGYIKPIKLATWEEILSSTLINGEIAKMCMAIMDEPRDEPDVAAFSVHTSLENELVIEIVQ
jgi:hypothetical protein